MQTDASEEGHHRKPVRRPRHSYMLGRVVRNPDFEPRQSVSRNRNRNRRPQVSMTSTGVLQPIPENRDPVEQSPRPPSPERAFINLQPHTQLDQQGALSHSEEMREKTNPLSGIHDLTVLLCEEKEKEKALFVKNRERTIRYLKEDLAYYHEKVTKDLGSLCQTLDRALVLNQSEEEAKLEERIDFERMVRRFGKGERLMRPVLEVAGRIDRQISRHPNVKMVMNGRRAGQLVKVAEEEERKRGQRAKPVKIDKELGPVVRNPDFEPRQSVSRNRNRNRRPQVSMTSTGVLQPIPENRDPVEQSPRPPSPERAFINLQPHTQLDQQGALSHSEEMREKTNPLSGIHDLTVLLCEEKEKEKALFVKARERTMRYLKEDLAYYHEKVTKDLASLGQTLDRALVLNQSEEEAKLEERIDFERMVRRFGKGERLMRPVLEVAGRIDRQISRHPNVKMVMNGRRAGQLVKVAEEEESKRGQRAKPVKIDKELGPVVRNPDSEPRQSVSRNRNRNRRPQVSMTSTGVLQPIPENRDPVEQSPRPPSPERAFINLQPHTQNDFATLESVSQNYRSSTPVTMTSLTSVSLTTAPLTASPLTATLQTTATPPLFLPVRIPPSNLQTTAAPPLPRPHRLPPLKVPPPTLAWPQTTHLPPISTQTEGGQTGNTDRTGTPVLTLDTNGDQTGETNEIDYDEVEEISILPDEERFQVKQVEKEEVKEKKEQENETGGAKKCRKTIKKRFIRWLRKMCCCGGCFQKC
ncbi:hypothetical protein J4Q44_G00326630 [Coregonus suidteri]|uniref:Uncharacterized protein n=1 Tax=Coregonus suidteri TaxID=861788 RepID=A0AAN8KX98_9TELE